MSSNLKTVTSVISYQILMLPWQPGHIYNLFQYCQMNLSIKWRINALHVKPMAEVSFLSFIQSY